MNRLINILYAMICMVLYVYLIVYTSGGKITEFSNDAQLIGLSIIIAGCLAYGGD